MNLIIYGQPCSGKSTLANALASKIEGYIIIDGDEVRRSTNNFDYSPSGRQLNIDNCIRVSNEAIASGKKAILSIMAPYIHLRKQIMDAVPDLVPVHVYYDKNRLTRGRESYWCKDFETSTDFTINTGVVSIDIACRMIEYYIDYIRTIKNIADLIEENTVNA